MVQNAMLEQELRDALIRAGYPDSINVAVESFHIEAGYKTPTTMKVSLRIIDLGEESVVQKFHIIKKGKLSGGKE